jgi:hypothetical protein
MRDGLSLSNYSHHAVDLITVGSNEVMADLTALIEFS